MAPYTTEYAKTYPEHPDMVWLSPITSTNPADLLLGKISTPAKIIRKLPLFGHNRQTAPKCGCDATRQEPSSFEQIQRTKLRFFRTISKTRLRLRRATNWSYEQQWRKERKIASFDPIFIPGGDVFLEHLHCDCECCPCIHMS